MQRKKEYLQQAIPHSLEIANQFLLFKQSLHFKSVSFSKRLRINKQLQRIEKELKKFV